MKHPWAGRDLGTRTVSYDENDAILYALAVGATAQQLDLVFERDLRVLPTFALVLGQWAPDAVGTAGAFDPRVAVHGSQRLDVHGPLPRAGAVEMSARVREVWDKGSAAVFDIEVAAEQFTAVWSVFAPGAGGFGGERGASVPRGTGERAREVPVATRAEQAALYRLLGDKHHIHVDPEAAKAIGAPRPILHGLCSLAASALALAPAYGAHPADLTVLEGRFASPVLPGDSLAVRDSGAGGFEVAVEDRTVISGGRIGFA
ncbi:MaoC/PaaZ C-terminal domain-containing protein, partial [Streptomyces incanus]